MTSDDGWTAFDEALTKLLYTRDTYAQMNGFDRGRLPIPVPARPARDPAADPLRPVWRSDRQVCARSEVHRPRPPR